MKRIVPAILALGLIAALTWALWPRPIPVEVESVSVGPMRVTVDEEGKTRIREKYIVSAPLAGRLRRIELDPGDVVRTGSTPIAVLEPSDPTLLDARTRAEAKARLNASAAAVKQAGTNLDRSSAALEHAQSEFARIRALRERSNVSKQELEDAELILRTRGEEYKAAQFAQQIAEFEHELAQATLDRYGNDSPGEETRFEILSPIDGRVLRVFEESAAVVAIGTPLVELGDPSDLEVEVDLLSSDAVRVPVGAEVLFEHWGGETPLAGRVRLVEPAAFTKISALGVEEQRVNVVADFVDPTDRRAALGDGYRVEARIVTWKTDSAVRLPASALFRDRDRWATFRVDDGVTRLVPLRIGHVNETYAEVLEGLAEGDLVIVHPSDEIADGIAVAPRAP